MYIYILQYYTCSQFLSGFCPTFLWKKPGFSPPGVRPSEAAHPSAASTRNRGRARGSDRVAIEVAIESSPRKHLNNYGQIMEQLWTKYGNIMDKIWKHYGKNMENYGTKMEKIWKTYGKNMEPLWKNYGQNYGTIMENCGHIMETMETN